MNQTLRKTAAEILDICRKNGVTLEDLLEGILGDNTISSNGKSKENLERRITNIMNELGIPADFLGYQYMRYAIMYDLQNQKGITGITTILYPAVAKEFKTTEKSVERSIRHAIAIASSSWNAEISKKYFGYTSYSNKNKPTNSKFIAMIVEYLKFN